MNVKSFTDFNAFDHAGYFLAGVAEFLQRSFQKFVHLLHSL